MQRFEDQFEFIWGEKFLSFQSTTLATMAQDYKPKSHAAALAVALLLAVTASTDEKAEQAQELASHIACKLNDEVQFEAVKDAVEACINYFSGIPA
jgi:NH3-dependent NAD+ synthetase